MVDDPTQHGQVADPLDPMGLGPVQIPIGAAEADPVAVYASLLKAVRGGNLPQDRRSWYEDRLRSVWGAMTEPQRAAARLRT